MGAGQSCARGSVTGRNRCLGVPCFPMDQRITLITLGSLTWAEPVRSTRRSAGAARNSRMSRPGWTLGDDGTVTI